MTLHLLLNRGEVMEPFRLKKYEGNPILKPNPKNQWEELVVCNPAAWYENGTFYMLYRAAGNDRDHFIYLGLATSKDGFHFERCFDKPVLAPTPNNYDAGCCEDPRLVKFENEFFLTYAYRPWAPGQYWREDKKVTIDLPMNDFLPTGLRWNVSQTALAISPDLIHWKKLGRITKYDSDNRDVILFPHFFISENLLWCAFINDFTSAHDDDAIGKKSFFHFVSNRNNGETRVIFSHLFDDVKYLFFTFCVNHRCRFIENQNLRG